MPSTSPFPALLDGLQAFHARVEGTQGNFRLALLASGQPARVREVSGSTLRVVHALLVWLRDGIDAVQRDLVTIDALLALGEVTVNLLQELGTGVTTTPPGLDGTALTSSLSALGQVVDAFPDASLLPTPELVAELRTVLELLVGLADTQAQAPSGALGELLQAIESLAA